MSDPRDPLFGSGLRREAVLCALCGTAWDERVVAAPSGDEPALSLCPSCLLTTSHGDPFPEEPAGQAADRDLSERSP
ncbi:MAG: hypothetical protein JWO60_176 [Frankiales bacterium]|nr:hypothetical protein [Frankiales bacterium]